MLREQAAAAEAQMLREQAAAAEAQMLREQAERYQAVAAEAQRVRDQAVAASWPCNACTYVNDATSANCLMCMAGFTAPAPVPAAPSMFTMMQEQIQRLHEQVRQLAAPAPASVVPALPTARVVPPAGQKRPRENDEEAALPAKKMPLCSYCGKPGHNITTCTEKAKAEAKAVYSCSYCGKSGHNIITCAEKAKADAKEAAAKKPYTCSRCGCAGHNVTSCTAKVKDVKKAKSSKFCDCANCRKYPGNYI